MALGTKILYESDLHAFLVDYDDCAVDKKGDLYEKLITKIIEIVKANPTAKFKLICFSRRQDFHTEKSALSRNNTGTAYEKLPGLVAELNQQLNNLKIPELEKDPIHFDPVRITDFYENLPPGTTHEDIKQAFSAPDRSDERSKYYYGHPVAVYDNTKITYTYGFSHYLSQNPGLVHMHIFDDQHDKILHPNSSHFSREPIEIPSNTALYFYNLGYRLNTPQVYNKVLGSGPHDENFPRTLRRVAILNYFQIVVEMGYRIYQISTMPEIYPFMALRQHNLYKQRFHFDFQKRGIARIKEHEAITHKLQTSNQLRLNKPQREKLKLLWQITQRCYYFGHRTLADILYKLIETLLTLLAQLHPANLTPSKRAVVLRRRSREKRAILRKIQSVFTEVKQHTHSYITEKNKAIQERAIKHAKPTPDLINYDLIALLNEIQQCLIGDQLVHIALQNIRSAPSIRLQMIDNKAFPPKMAGP